MQLKDIVTKCHKDAIDLGWYDKDKTKSDIETLMMAVTELSEVVEELRKPEAREYYIGDNDKPEGYGVEIADAIIRLLDLCAFKGIDIEKLILEKLEYNLTRGYRHGNKLY